MMESVGASKVVRKDPWRAVAAGAAATLALVAGTVAVALRDPDAAMLTIGVLLSLGLLRLRSGVLGLIGLGIAFALTAFWCVIGALFNFAHRSSFFGDALTSVLGVVALAGLIAVAGAAFKTRNVRAIWVVRFAAFLVVAALFASFVASRSAHSVAHTGDIMLVAKHVKFSKTRIVTKSGRIGVDIVNRDFFWHTFTVSKLRVSLNVATRGESRIDFVAPPGTYEFKCLIPGHTQAGMKGTLVVR